MRNFAMWGVVLALLITPVVAMTGRPGQVRALSS
jgi:hypothetical protein